jgi:hypothetical protein
VEALPRTLRDLGVATSWTLANRARLDRAAIAADRVAAVGVSPPAMLRAAARLADVPMRGRPAGESDGA